MNATATDAIRFTAVRLAGRWKVEDAATGETVTCASRAKAEERAAKLNAAEERAGTTLQERSQAPRTLGEMNPEERAAVVGKAVAQLQEELTAAAPAIAKVLEEPLPGEAPLEVVTLDGTETTVIVEETVESYGPDAVVVTREYELTPEELAEAVNAGTITFAEAAAKLPAPAAAPAEKAEPMKSLWVAAAFVPIILADAAPERATLVAKLDASVPNNRGGRTVRLTRAEAEELAAIGTEIENAAGGVGRNAHSARTMRARLAALWA